MRFWRDITAKEVSLVVSLTTTKGEKEGTVDISHMYPVSADTGYQFSVSVSARTLCALSEGKSKIWCLVYCIVTGCNKYWSRGQSRKRIAELDIVDLNVS